MGAEADDPRTAERVGAVLADKWTLERLIGTGGMGAVYEARHRNGARAALKILHPDLARVPEVRERFLREGYAANRVEHRGAVKVLDDDFVKEGPDAGSAYLVMEMLHGESLETRSLRPPLVKEMEMLEIMDAVLDVLDAAHAHGVVHRDLKPENLFLAQDEDAATGVRVKVLDFGLARINEVAGQTSAGLALGTPSFMSPEQAAGKTDEIDGQTDIFALGATAFRIITGRRIHDAENVVQLVVKMATIPAPPIREVMPDVSEHFARVVDKALAFEKKDRFLSAAAMREDVRAALLALRGDADTVHVAPYSQKKKSLPAIPAHEERAADRAEPKADGATPPSPRSATSSRSVPWEPPQPSRLPFLLLFAAVLSIVAFKFGDEVQAKLERLAQPFQVKQTAALPPATSAPATPPSVTSVDLDDAGLDDAGLDDDDTADNDASATAFIDDVLGELDDASVAPAASATPHASAPAPHKPNPPAPHPPPPSHKPTPPKRPPPHPPHRPRRR